MAKDSLDEWIYFLKNEDIKGDFPAKGLAASKEKLDYMKLNEAERLAHEENSENQRYRASMIEFSIKRAEEQAKRAEQEAKRAEAAARQAEEQAKSAVEDTQMAIDALLQAGLSKAEAMEKLEQPPNQPIR